MKLWEAGCVFCPKGKNHSEGRSPPSQKLSFPQIGYKLEKEPTRIQVLKVGVRNFRGLDLELLGRGILANNETLDF